MIEYHLDAIEILRKMKKQVQTGHHHGPKVKPVKPVQTGDNQIDEILDQLDSDYEIYDEVQELEYKVL